MIPHSVIDLAGLAAQRIICLIFGHGELEPARVYEPSTDQYIDGFECVHCGKKTAVADESKIRTRDP